MKKKLIVSSIVIAAAAAGISGGTYAAFTDSETTPVQSFAAGTLDIEFTDTNLSNSAIGYPIEATNQQPGATEPTRQIHVTNTGTLPARISVYLKKVTDAEGVVTDAELTAEPTANDDAFGELDNNMKLNIDGFVGGGDTLAALAVGGKALVNGAGQPGADSIFTLAPGADKWLAIDWEIPYSVGNEIMGDSTSFEVVFEAAQVD